MDKPKTGPKDFFMWAGAMIALYAGVFSFVGLVFDYINYAFPDAALSYYYYDPYQGSVSYEMASLIVLAPLLLILMRVIRRSIQADPSRNEIWVRRWALFLVLFVAGATMAIDLIVLINTFLQGEELSARFLLKALVVFLVAGAGFLHFIADLRGYWQRNPGYARYVSWAVGVLVVATILSGFLIIGSPSSARQHRLDARRVQDLQSIQSQIINYWQAKESLPAKLSDLNDSLSYWQEPMDPVTNQPYEYKRNSPLDFSVCATFSTEGDSTGPSMARMGKADNWSHPAGSACFDRSIDPELYPPFKK